jgi:hypothetical protein
MKTHIETPQVIPDAPENEVVDIRHLTPHQLKLLGMPHLAYIKPVFMDGAAAFAIHAADGSPMAVATDRDLAINAVVEHEMFPTLVH